MSTSTELAIELRQIAANLHGSDYAAVLNSAAASYDAAMTTIHAGNERILQLNEELQSARSEFDRILNDKQEIEALHANQSRTIAAYMTDVASRDDTIQELRRRHGSDIKIIGDRLNQEAEERGWCDIYDNVVNDINSQLYVTLPVRTIDVTARCTVELDLDFRFTTDADLDVDNSSDVQARLDTLLDHRVRTELRKRINDLVFTYFDGSDIMPIGASYLTVKVDGSD